MRLFPEKFTEPFTWPSPRAVFVNSMNDLFLTEVPVGYIEEEEVVKVMVETKWHTYQVLTKRADRLQEMLSRCLRFASGQRYIWWGVSVEGNTDGHG